jgi:hypothetical protein
VKTPPESRKVECRDLIQVVDQVEDLDRRSRWYRAFGFWGFERERWKHCIMILQIMKSEVLGGVALGHRTGSHGEGLREGAKNLSPVSGFGD